MIPFRFHLVSLTAVFLALAAGIVIGSGVVDRATVDFLEQRVAEVERNREQTNARNDELRAALDVAARYSAGLEPHAIAGRLADRTVLILALPGVEPETTARLGARVASASATPATVSLTSRWDLDVEGTAELTALLGADEELPEPELRALAVRALLEHLAAEETSATVEALRREGFVTIDGEEPTVPSDALVAIVSSGADQLDPEDELDIIGAIAGTRPSVVVAAPPADEEGEAEGSLIETLRQSEIGAQVSSVDNASEPAGEVAAVLALAEAARGGHGHYGLHESAISLLPPAPTP